MNQFELVERLNELRDLARTGLPAHGMRDKQWAQYRLAKIAQRLNAITKSLEVKKDNPMRHLYFVSYSYTTRTLHIRSNKYIDSNEFGNITLKRNSLIDSEQKKASVERFIKENGVFEDDLVKLVILDIILLKSALPWEVL